VGGINGTRINAPAISAIKSNCFSQVHFKTNGDGITNVLDVCWLRKCAAVTSAILKLPGESSFKMFLVSVPKSHK